MTLDDWLAHAERTHPRDIALGLDRVAAVAARLDVLPPAPRTAIVAGTNGKGSTCVALEALLLAAGLTVGTTLSPHVHRFNERVRVNGRELDDTSLCEAFAAVEAARGEVPLTYFEYGALVAMLCFRRAGVDVAILEVGLGGRLDAMNVVSADVAVITSIGLDHQDWLGDDVEQIGREKAGVLRASQFAVLGRTVTRSVLDRAAELNCQVSRAGLDFTVERGADCWAYRAADGALAGLPYGPLSDVSIALAIRAAAAFTTVRRRDVEAAIRAAALPGRCEPVRWRERTLVLDVAHNPAGAEFLLGELQRRHPETAGAVVLGMLADKDAAGYARALEPFARAWFTVDVGGSRGQSAAALAGRLATQRPVTAAADLGTALAAARSATGPTDVILVAGSFAVVERAREMLQHAEVVTADE